MRIQVDREGRSANYSSAQMNQEPPPTYFNRKVGDRFIYRGVVHRVVAIHQKEREERMMVMKESRRG